MANLSLVLVGLEVGTTAVLKPFARVVARSVRATLAAMASRAPALDEIGALFYGASLRDPVSAGANIFPPAHRQDHESPPSAEITKPHPPKDPRLVVPRR